MDYKQIKASIIEGESGLIISRDEFVAKVEQKIRSFGQLKNSNVVIVCEKPVELIIEMLALWSLGCTVLPIQEETSEKEIENIVNKIGINYILREGIASECLSSSKKISNCLLLLLTSGTTGMPKAVKVSGESLGRKIKKLQEELGTFEVTLNALPLSFGHGLICNTLYPLFTSSKLVLYKKFDLELLLNIESIINKYAINFFSTVPSIWQMKFKLQTDKSKIEMNSLKRINVASSTLAPELEEKILNWTRKEIVYDMYGSTEMLGWFAERKCGKELDFKKKWDVEEKVIEGVLYLKSNYMFDGYLNIDNSKDINGFYCTGDVFKDNKIVGRIDDVVNKAGLKIYLEEIDNLVMSSGLVMDACSYSLKDEISGERFGLAIVCSEGKAVEDVEKYLKQSMNQNKLPDEIRKVNFIFRNERGKLVRQKNTGRKIE